MPQILCPHYGFERLDLVSPGTKGENFSLKGARRQVEVREIEGRSVVVLESGEVLSGGTSIRPY